MSSYRDEPRGSGRGGYPHDRDARDRSRSPGRRYDDRDRDRADRSERYDRPDPRERSSRGGYRDGPPRGERDPPPHRAGYGRDDDRERGYERSGGGGRYDRDGPRGYDRNGRDGGRSYGGGRDADRPLDRRAIEEGRRRREEERAAGIKYAADGSRIVPEEEKDESADATPVPEGEEMDDETAAMASMMGFGGFGTSKGQEVEGNDVSGAKTHKKRTWRQYMNRRGGFNRALDKI
ncbi:U4/U6U5 small nuclear ribonucleoprotein [Vanrija pseudolonga]|uniref:U4/U6U5 small nuclear ribonucleoprotein n=1 Tax=Vanrija pseudolonga TaxID=143232 RepID=A0AAF0YCG2_9TREE|nr:U4/U6U5 small nuclear ribonucleoprotein [Vanrija pseudolonga]